MTRLERAMQLRARGHYLMMAASGGHDVYQAADVLLALSEVAEDGDDMLAAWYLGGASAYAIAAQRISRATAQRRALGGA